MPEGLEDHTTDIVGCARCHGQGHENLTFKPLTNPIEVWSEETGPVKATYWAPCPTNGEPILMAFFVKPIVCER